MPITPDQLNDLRKRVLAKEHYTQEELTAAVREQIAERLSAFESPSKKSSKKTTSTKVDLSDLI